MAKFDLFFVIRGVAGVAFLIAVIFLSLANQQVQVTQSSTILITFVDWPGLLYCLIVYIIGCVYNLFALLIPPGYERVWKAVTYIDKIMIIAVGASLVEGWNIESLIRDGYLAGRWYPLCGRVYVFCNRLFLSLIMASIGFVLSSLLTFYTHRYLVMEQ